MSCKYHGESASDRWQRHMGAHRDKTMAVYTSGGDAQGMNAALRAVIRMAIFMGCKPYLVYEGYQGMIDGGDKIKHASWVTVSTLIHRGGTFIGSSRCEAFRERSGRLLAAANLLQHGISNLVVIGGDGSMEGACMLREEWPTLLDELLDDEKITKQQRKRCGTLNIVGIMGSIDNDFNGTDMTIGVDSALHRITEAVDSIVDTAYSHQRTFILQTMGRQCGYLALVTCLISEADYFFIPEFPPPRNWRDQLCSKLSQERATGKRANIIVMAEGAIDTDGDPISADVVRQIIVERLQQDVRITVLGHVQRGGCPSAFDRILGCRMGAEAVLALMETTPYTPPMVIVCSGQSIAHAPLAAMVERTRAVSEAMACKQYPAAVEMRGPSFEHNLMMCYHMLSLNPTQQLQSHPHRIAVLHVGKPACGMNAAVFSFVRNCMHQGEIVLGISDGIDGLIANHVRPFNWMDVNGWVRQGGANLGTKRTMPNQRLHAIARSLRKNSVDGLLIIGGFNAFVTALQLYRGRMVYGEFRIPIAIIPATIDNNVPGTELSLGCDTTLNEITDICDRIRQSAQGTNHRVFIIETMGGYCGYLATMGGLAGGADTAYIYEEKFNVRTLHADAIDMMAKMCATGRGLILCNENASPNYNTDFIHRLYKEEGRGYFSCRMNVLGHLQQGGTPSPYDRSLGVKFGCKCAQWFNEQFQRGLNVTTTKDSVCVCGLVNGVYSFTPVEDLVSGTNFEKRLPPENWWLKIRPLLSYLSKHESAHRMMRPPDPTDGTKLTIVIRQMA